MRPIHLTISVPKGVVCRASVPIREGDVDIVSAKDLPNHKGYRATLTEAKDKTGELFIGIDRAA